MMRAKILIDCDPGLDDAIAILTAARHLDLVAVTTCHGNGRIEATTRNALAVLSLAGLDIPVAAGCGMPLLGRPPENDRTILDLPPPARTPIAAHAVDLLIEQARAHRGELVLAVTGPATNVAVALAREPRLPFWLREISVMGGSAGAGNVTAVAEFNVWSDPEAAAVLFGCGAPIRMIGCDLTSRIRTGAAEIARLCSGGRVAGRFANLLGTGGGGAPLHDVCAIIPYIAPDLIETRPCHVAVECAGTLTRGMTVCDRRETAPRRNVRLAEHADAPGLLGIVTDSLLAYGDGGDG